MSKRDDVVRCVHRQDIYHHPSCHAKGLLRGKGGNKKGENKIVFEDEKSFVKRTGKEWYEYPGNSMCFLDIESDGLKADFATMLTWTIKIKDGPIISDVITKEELFNGNTDRRIVESCVNELSKHQIVCSYFGKGFDVPFLRSKAFHYEIDFPDYGELYHFDLYYWVKSKFNLARKSLDSITDYLGIKGKTPLDREIWRRGKYGDPEALKQILIHNVEDCKILESLYKRIFKQSKGIKSSL